MHHPFRCIVPALAALLLPPLARAEEGGFVRMRVVKVLDGDTFHAVPLEGFPAGAKRIRDSLVSVRLGEIDAPEKAQVGGMAAKAALDSLIAGRTVQVRIDDIDRYRRVVGWIRLGRVEVNERMVERGNAWMYRHYSRSPRLDSLEKAARAAHRGLWAEREPQEPSEWRREHRR